MKTISIDTNNVNENGTLYVSEVVIKGMKLQAGEKIIVYQENDSWEAEVIFQDDEWGIKLTSDSKEISYERQEGHMEGFWEGYYLQSIRLLRVLNSLNLSNDIIEKIKEKLDL